MEFWQHLRSFNQSLFRASHTILVICATLVATSVDGQTPNEWVAAGNGSWDTTGNWSLGTVPDSSNAAVLFENSLLADASVSVDSARTVESITFDNSIHQYTLTGGSTLFLAGNPVVDVLSGLHQIDVNLGGSSGFTKRGSGTLNLPGFSSLRGTVVVAEGTLEVFDEKLPADTTRIEAGAVVVGGRSGFADERRLELREGQVITGTGVLDVGLLDVQGDPNNPFFRGELRGNLTIDTTVDPNGRVENRGFVAPGLLSGPSTLGTLNILGDYETTANDAELEIEVDGSQYDRLTISGNAFIDGQLTVALVNGYVPNPDDTITLIEASGIGYYDDTIFNSVLAPNLGLVTSTPKLSVEISTSVDGSNVELKFVPVSTTPVQFNNTTSTVTQWFNNNNWSTGSNPSNRDNVVVQNQNPTQDQRVEIDDNDESPIIIHQLDVLGSGGRAMVLEVDSPTLSVIDRISIASGGELDLRFGKVVSRLTTIGAGGRLTGDGTIVGDIVVAAGGQLSPGDEAGSCCGNNISQNGNLSFAPGSELKIQLGDNIDVSGNVVLGGTLVVEVDEFDVQLLGFQDVQMFMSVESVVGQFEDVQFIAPDGFHFAIVEFINDDGTNVVGVCGMGAGDMNCDNSIDMDDVPLFAQALADPEAFRNSCPVEGVLGCIEPPEPDDWGDVDNDGDGLDFDDIDDFVALVLLQSNLSAVEITAAILSYGSTVPEPSSLVLLICASCWFVASRRYCEEGCEEGWEEVRK